MPKFHIRKYMQPENSFVFTAANLTFSGYVKSLSFPGFFGRNSGFHYRFGQGWHAPIEESWDISLVGICDPSAASGCALLSTQKGVDCNRIHIWAWPNDADTQKQRPHLKPFLGKLLSFGETLVLVRPRQTGDGIEEGTFPHFLCCL